MGLLEDVFFFPIIGADGNFSGGELLNFGGLSTKKLNLQNWRFTAGT